MVSINLYYHDYAPGDGCPEMAYLFVWMCLSGAVNILYMFTIFKHIKNNLGAFRWTKWMFNYDILTH